MENAEINEVYRKIMEVLGDSYAITDNELAKKLCFADPNKVRPRRNELFKLGLVESVGKRPDRYTKKTSIIWILSKQGKKIISRGVHI